MNVVGIIAEYNPFHKGHQYHLEETRRKTEADYLIVVMSPNFTQRGQAAIMDKYSRAKQALLCGADLVLELPVRFSCASAKDFALGGVSLLQKLGIVQFLSFGSEQGALTHFLRLAAFLRQEPKEFKAALQSALKQGLSYPKARAFALQQCSLVPESPWLPNDILALEYCLALLKLDSSIKPVTIRRYASNYHDLALSSTGYSSAASIRKVLQKKESSWVDFSSLQNHIPHLVLQELKQDYGQTFPLETNDFSSLLHYQLLLHGQKELTVYADVHPDLADRIQKRLNQFTTIESFCDLLKTKELTYTRISRSLLHILLSITKEEVHQGKQAGYTPYGRVLGFRKDASPLLHAIKQHSSIPLITKLADAKKKLDPVSFSLLQTDIRSSHIYESVGSHKFHRPFRHEYSRQFPILSFD